MSYNEPGIPLEVRSMRGYKGFFFDLSCRPVYWRLTQYEIGKTYTVGGPVVLCQKGFHYCPNILDVYRYCFRSFDIRICEVEASGSCERSVDNAKFVTGQLTVVRELTVEEILDRLRQEAHPTEGISWAEAKCKTLSFNQTLIGINSTITNFISDPHGFVLWNTTKDRYHFPTKKELPRLEERATAWRGAINKHIEQNGAVK